MSNGRIHLGFSTFASPPAPSPGDRSRESVERAQLEKDGVDVFDDLMRAARDGWETLEYDHLMQHARDRAAPASSPSTQELSVNRKLIERLFLAVLAAAAAVAAAGCGGDGGASASGGGKLTLVAYSTAQEAYAKIIPGFQ